MSISESDFFDVGMSLPSEVRKHVALRLLESVESQDACAKITEDWWHTEAAVSSDRTLPAEDVPERLESKWANPLAQLNYPVELSTDPSLATFGEALTH